MTSPVHRGGSDHRRGRFAATGYQLHRTAQFLQALVVRHTEATDSGRSRGRGWSARRAIQVVGATALALTLSVPVPARTAAGPGTSSAALPPAPDPPATLHSTGQTEWSAGLGAILVPGPWPFGHVEARYHVSHQASVAGFVSAMALQIGLLGASTGFALVNAGVEARYHFAPGSSYDPHVGAGGGLLVGAAERSASSTPWVWANAGVTFLLGPTLRLDLEVSPALLLGGGLGLTAEAPVLVPLPFARLRWIL